MEKSIKFNDLKKLIVGDEEDYREMAKYIFDSNDDEISLIELDVLKNSETIKVEYEDLIYDHNYNYSLKINGKYEFLGLYDENSVELFPEYTDEEYEDDTKHITNTGFSPYLKF